MIRFPTFVVKKSNDMIYQLPSGKIVHLSIEQYLDLTDEDIEYMISMNFGDYAKSPFHGSAIFNQKKKKKKIDDDKEVAPDKSMDYIQDTEDLPMNDRVILSEDMSPENSPDLDGLDSEED